MIWIIIYNYIIQIIDFNNNHMDNHPWMIIMIVQNNISHWLFWCHFMLHFWQWIPPCPATVPGPCWPDAEVGTNTRPATGDDMDSLVTELYASLINKGIKGGGANQEILAGYSDIFRLQWVSGYSHVSHVCVIIGTQRFDGTLNFCSCRFVGKMKQLLQPVMGSLSTFEYRQEADLQIAVAAQMDLLWLKMMVHPTKPTRLVESLAGATAFGGSWLSERGSFVQWLKWLWKMTAAGIVWINKWVPI